MKRIIVILAILIATLPLYAQQTLSSKEMIAITPMLADGVDLPQNAKTILNMKLRQMATQNGFGSTSNEFVLTASSVVIDKQVTATAPQQYITKLEVSVYVLNAPEGVIMNEMSFEVQGVDRIENKSVIQAINQIKPKSVKVRAFMDQARTKIVEYYNTRIPNIIIKAQSLAERDGYNQALFLLSTIPETVDQYPLVAEQMTAIYRKMTNKESADAIQEASAKLAKGDYWGAADALEMVDPTSDHASKVAGIAAQIEKKLDEKQKDEFKEKIKKMEMEREATDRAEESVLERTRRRAAASDGYQEVKAGSYISLLESLNGWYGGRFR